MTSSSEDFLKEDRNELIETNSADFSSGVYEKEILLNLRKLELSRTCPLSHEQIKNLGLDRETVRVVSQSGWAPKPNRVNKVGKLADLPLVVTKNAWKPKLQRAAENISKAEYAIRDVSEKVRAILNKVTPANLDEFTDEFLYLNVSSNRHQLTEVVKIIFENASEGSMYSALFASICKAQIDHERMNEESSAFDQAIHSHVNKISSHIKTRVFRKASAFISHLRCNQLIPRDVLQRSFLKLFSSILPEDHFAVTPTWDRKSDERFVVCGLEMLQIIGPCIEKKKRVPNVPTLLDYWFQVLKDVNLPRNSRIHCLIKNILELRENKWIPRVPKRAEAYLNY